MKKDEKQQKAEELHKDLEKARGVVFSGFEGITVAQDTELRRKLVQAGSTYRVVKNTLIERAAQGTSAAPVAQKLRGTTSLAYTESDPVALAKAISSYAKDHPILVFKAGVVEGRVVSMADLTSIASLPSREALLAKVLYLINAAAQRTASSIAGVARNLAGVIQQAVKENKFRGSREEDSEGGGRQTAVVGSGENGPSMPGSDALRLGRNAVSGVFGDESKLRDFLKQVKGSGINVEACDFRQVESFIRELVPPAQAIPVGGQAVASYQDLPGNELEVLQQHFRQEVSAAKTRHPDLFQ